MADNDEPEPQFNSLKERIAALNQQKSFNATNADGTRKRPPPPPPPPGRTQTAPANTNGNTNGNTAAPAAPSVPSRPTPKAQPPPLPRRDTSTSVASSQDGAQPQIASRGPPPLPNRTASATSQQALTTKKSAQSLRPSDRRGSASSGISQMSTASNMSAVSGTGPNGRFKLPPAFDKNSLPALPPSKREMEARAQQEADTGTAARPRPPPVPTRSDTSVSTRSVPTPSPARPSLPPRLPSRPSKAQESTTDGTSHQTANGDANGASNGRTPAQAVSQLKYGSIRGFGSGSNNRSKAPEQINEDKPLCISQRATDEAPPPVPLASRPTMAQIEAVSTRAASGMEEECWVCKDWSGPDNVAAQYPRQSLPRNDPVGYLAQVLCDPFPSYTDKARAIFTWFHHNIAYDTVSFFGKCVKHVAVDDTIFTGKAVCQGYAEVYKAIANRAGLECVLISGHGKGIGHKDLKPGEPVPPRPKSNHAWNAVRIDGGKWNLIDACWGAGHVDSATQSFTPKFNQEMFIATNEIFGERHLPTEDQYQFRNDGRAIGWEEYFIGEGIYEKPTYYTTAGPEGILERSVQPKEKYISVNSNEVIRFQWSKICPHWKYEEKGRPKAPLLFLSIHGKDGRKDDMVPIETDGYWSWCDVRASDLGAPGQELQVAVITNIGGKDARGLTAEEYFSKRGKVGMSWSYLLRWELA